MGKKIIKPPLMDTFISSSSKSMKRANEYLVVGTRKHHNYRSLLQFDLSCLPDNLTILSSTLHVYLLKKFPFTNELELLQIISKWQPNKVSWHNQPLTASSPVDTITLKKESNCFLSFDITTLLQDWYANDAPNLGILLSSKHSLLNNAVCFAGREFCNAECWPYLEITFLDGTPPATDCCKTFERSEHVIASYSPQWTKPLNLLMFNYAYFAVNNGDSPILVTLEISPNLKKWLAQTPPTTVAPGAVICLAPDYGAKWSRVQYQTVEAHRMACTAIYIQGRS